MNLKKISRNLHELYLEDEEKQGNSGSYEIAMLSDLHWDNPHCNRELLKDHLDYCLENNIPVMLNGDTFCLMEGKGDPRRSKNIRPEHSNTRYLDSIVETAVDWFSPYAHILTVIGYGNHETGIIKHQETDLLRRFVDLLNYKEKSNVQVGGYGGWLNVKVRCRRTSYVSYLIKYYHGSGGGGVVTKGAINLTRAMQMYEGMDCFTMGHIHENSSRDDVRDTITRHARTGLKIIQKNIHLMHTGTYKDEYEDGYEGFRVERGRPPKICGGRLLKLSWARKREEDKDALLKSISSSKFPLI